MDKFAVRCKKCWSIKQERKICHTCNERASKATPWTRAALTVETTAQDFRHWNAVVSSRADEVHFGYQRLFWLPPHVARVTLERAPAKPHVGQRVWDQEYGPCLDDPWMYEATLRAGPQGIEYCVKRGTQRRTVRVIDAWFVREIELVRRPQRPMTYAEAAVHSHREASMEAMRKLPRARSAYAEYYYALGPAVRAALPR